jgi:UDP-N-acetylmuramate dehydrogenase
MKHKYKNIIDLLGENRVSLNEPLAAHTYFKIGGPADLFVKANEVNQLSMLVNSCIKTKTPYFILGGGSNILVGDKGVRGMVIKNRANTIKIQKYKGKVKDKKINVEEAEVYAESGVITNLLVRRTIQEGLTGLEYFLGVPGTIGGAIYNNSHYKNELIGDRVDRVQVVDTDGNNKMYSRDRMEFEYDSSILQKTKETVLSVTFRLRGGDADQIWKKAEKFARNRSGTQPLNLPNSGCIFKNIKTKHNKKLQNKEKLTSAGQLIDAAGLKGTRIGGAMISDKHANFIINTGKATANDVVELISLIKKKVHNKFSVNLELEIFKVGEF